MVKLTVLFGFVLATTFNSCKQAPTENKNINAAQNERRLQFDTSHIAILDFEAAHEALPRNAQPSQLNQDDFYSIDYLLKEPVEYANIGLSKMYEDYRKESPNDHPPKDWFMIDLNRFKRQYIPFKNDNGEREVLVICFRPDTVPESDNRVWKEIPFPSQYGGHHAFRVRINLTKTNYSDLQLNGYG